MRHLLILALFLFLLGGCSSKPPLLPESMQAQQPAYDLSDWVLEGRMSLRMEDRSDSVSIHWQQKQRDYEINVSAGPFNQSVARLEGRPGFVEMQVAGEDTLYTARSPEALMNAMLGWSLPVSHGIYWVKGIPDPNVVFEIHESERGFSFAQSGWKIDASRFEQVNPNLLLPRRIRMEREGLTITLVVSQWRI